MSATPEHSIWLVLQYSWIICIYFRAPDYRIRDKDFVDKLQLTWLRVCGLTLSGREAIIYKFHVMTLWNKT